MTAKPTLETIMMMELFKTQRLISHPMEAHHSGHCCCQTRSTLQEVDVTNVDHVLIIVHSSLGKEQIHVKGSWGSNDTELIPP